MVSKQDPQDPKEKSEGRLAPASQTPPQEPLAPTPSQEEMIKSFEEEDPVTFWARRGIDYKTADKERLARIKQTIGSSREQGIGEQFMAAPLRAVAGAAQGASVFADMVLNGISDDLGFAPGTWDLPDWDNRALGTSSHWGPALVEGGLQFMIPWVGATKYAPKAMGMISKASPALGRAATVAAPTSKVGQYAAKYVVGAGAVDMVAYMGNEGRLADLLVQYPQLRKPLTEWLASDPNDSEAMGRFKNAVEGSILGLFADIGLRVAGKGLAKAKSQLTPSGVDIPALPSSLDKGAMPTINEKDAEKSLADIILGGVKAFRHIVKRQADGVSNKKIESELNQKGIIQESRDSLSKFFEAVGGQPKQVVALEAMVDAMGIDRSRIREKKPWYQDDVALQEGAKGEVTFYQDGTAFLEALNKPDFSTGVHELAHVGRRFLFDLGTDASSRSGISDDMINTAADWAGATFDEKAGRHVWSVDAEEKFARGFENYLRTGKAPTEGLQGFFDTMASWMREVYARVKGSSIDIDVSPEMRKVFDDWLTVDGKNLPEVDIRRQTAGGAETLAQKAAGVTSSKMKFKVSLERGKEELRKHLGRLVKLKERDVDYPGRPQNPRTVIKAPEGSGEPDWVVGEITFDDWIKRTETVLDDAGVETAKDWYKTVFPVFIREAKGDEFLAYRMAQAWLAGQQGESGKKTMEVVIHIAEQLRRGVPREQIKGKTKSKVTEVVIRALEDVEVESGISRKISDFLDSAHYEETRAIMGNDPAGGAPVVVDRHSGRDSGLLDGATINRLEEKGYEVPDGLIEDMKGESVKETSYEERAIWFRDLTKHLNSIGWKGKSDWLPLEVQAVGWDVQVKWSDYPVGGGDALVSFDRARRRIAMELSPGEGSPWDKEYALRIKALSPEEQVSLNNEVVPEAIRLASEPEGILPLETVVHGTGGWRLDLESSTVLQAPMSREAGLRVARRLGYLLNQTEVWMHQGKALTKNADSFFIDITSSSDVLRTEEGLKSLWERILSIDEDGFIGGFQPVALSDGSIGIRVIIPGADAFGGGWKQIAKKLKISQAEAKRRIEEFATKRLEVDLKKELEYDATVGFGESVLDIVRNDWNKNKNGQNYSKDLHKGRGRAAVEGRANLDSDRKQLNQFLEERLRAAEGRATDTLAQAAEPTDPRLRNRRIDEDAGMDPVNMDRIHSAADVRATLQDLVTDAAEGARVSGRTLQESHEGAIDHLESLADTFSEMPSEEIINHLLHATPATLREADATLGAAREYIAKLGNQYHAYISPKVNSKGKWIGTTAEMAESLRQREILFNAAEQVREVQGGVAQLLGAQRVRYSGRGRGVAASEVPPKIETPKVETPEIKAPRVEAPEAEAPKVDTPEAEAEAGTVAEPGVEVPEIEYRTPEARERGQANQEAWKILALIDKHGGFEKVQKRLAREKVNGRENPTKAIPFHQSSKLLMLNEYFVNNILSGPITQAINLTGGIWNAVIHPLEGFVGYGLSMNPESRKQAWRELSAYHAMAVEGLESIRIAHRAFWDDSSKLIPEGGGGGLSEEMHRASRAISPESFGLERKGLLKGDSSWESIQGLVMTYIGNTVNLPSRFLLTGDEFFKQLRYRSNMRIQITERAAEMFAGNPEARAKYIVESMENIGRDGHMYSKDALYKKGFSEGGDIPMDDLVDSIEGGAEIRAAVIKEAEGLENLDEASKEFYVHERMKDAYANQFVKDNWDSALGREALESRQSAREATYTQDLEKSAGEKGITASALSGTEFSVRGSITGLSAGYAGLANAHPILRFFTPFIRTPTNLLMYFMERGPGAVSDTAGALYNHMAKGQSLSVKEAANLKGRIATGVTLFTTAYYMASDVDEDGVPRLVGSLPKDPGQRKIWKQHGIKPYSYRVPGSDIWIEYRRLDPAATFFGLVADMTQEKHMAELMNRKPEVMQAAFVGLIENLAHKSYLMGVFNLSEVMNNPDKNHQSFLNQLVTGFALGSSFTHQVVNPVFKGDRVFHEIRSWTDAWQSRFIGSDPTKFPVKRNLFGEPIKRDRGLGSDMFSPLRYLESDHSGLTRELVRIGANFNTPDKIRNGIDWTKHVNSEGVTAYDKMQEMHGTMKLKGKNLKQAMAHIIKNKKYQKLPLTGFEDLDSPRARILRPILSAYRQAITSKIIWEDEFPTLKEVYTQSYKNDANLWRGDLEKLIPLNKK